MSTKVFHSGMSGAPVLSGAAGAGIAILDACLINGFGLVSIDNLVIAGGVGTITRSAGMPFERDVMLLIAGVTGGAAAANGERRVLSVATNSATIDCTGIADQTATGSITAKLAPAGWVKEFAGSNLAVYKMSDVTSLGMRLRVDDTATTVMRVVGYESMSDINTGTGPFPTNAQIAGGGYWEKSGAAGATARNWCVIADERAVYWWAVPNAVTSVTSQGVLRGFGDMVPRKSTDAYAAFLQCDQIVMVTSATNVGDFGDGTRVPLVTCTAPRSWTGLGSSVFLGQYMESRRGNGTNVKSGSTAALIYPNSCDNALDLDRVLATEADLSTRGFFPGLLHCPQQVGFAFASFDKLDGQGSLAGRRLMALRCGAPGGTTQNSTTGAGSFGVVFFDISGGWRS
ncbi:hypothetical protein [Ideonella sp.]|uniref:hypothetical protein n=1 Tax=Ideonella sp. TaxID=1929293 RepID=UPI003BB5525E